MIMAKRQPRREVVIYARFSPRPDEQAERTQTIECQLESCRRWAEQNGYLVVGAHIDRERSGADEDRPGLWAAVDSLARGQCLLVYKLDRLARDAYLLLNIERMVQANGGRVLSAQGEGNEGDEDARLLRIILAAMDERVRTANAARTKHAMLRLQAAGRSISRWAPYGMRFTDQRDEHGRVIMAPDPAEQLVILRIVKLREAGKSCRGIARILNNEHVPAKLAASWNHVTVAKILTRAEAELRSTHHCAM